MCQFFVDLCVEYLCACTSKSIQWLLYSAHMHTGDGGGGGSAFTYHFYFLFTLCSLLDRFSVSA